VSKTGVDDFLVAGGTIEALLAAATNQPPPDLYGLQKVKNELRLRRMALKDLDAEDRPEPQRPALMSLTELLARPPVENRFRIAGLWPIGGKVLMSAPKKAGKTTLVGNLSRCLIDGDPFLEGAELPYGAKVDPRFNAGQRHPGFTVLPVSGTVTLLDFEMSEHQLREWLRDQEIKNLDRVRVQLMRGSGPWDIREDDVRARWADALRAAQTEVLIVDPLGPVMQSLGIEENSNTEVGRFLVKLDELCHQAGVCELFVVHHTGHEGERSRGASCLLGWPDAIWSMTVGDGEGWQAPRFVRAEGRDVDLSNHHLELDRNTRRLGLGRTGSKAAQKAAQLADDVLKTVEQCPGETFRDLVKILQGNGMTKVSAETSIKDAVSNGLIHTHPGARRALFHHPGPLCETCP
jgi:hypothetical protein